MRNLRFLEGGRIVHSHFLLVLFAAGQFALLVQEVDESHQQQEQQNTHHHGYHHSAGASLLLIGCSTANRGTHGRRDGEVGGVSGDTCGWKVREGKEEGARLGGWGGFFFFFLIGMGRSISEVWVVGWRCLISFGNRQEGRWTGGWRRKGAISGMWGWPKLWNAITEKAMGATAPKKNVSSQLQYHKYRWTRTC